MLFNYKKTIEYILDHFIITNSKSVRDFISNRNYLFGKYTMVPITENTTLNEVLGQYRFFDLRKDDIVLDIGANVGGFSMFVCESVKKVYAIEPLFADILNKNIKNNHLKNIMVYAVGLGLYPIFCKYMSREKLVKGVPLHILIELCGGKVDFLKCDCEGGEWCIQPHELKGIRRIEMEVHSFNGEKLTDFSDMLIGCGYEVDITDHHRRTMIIHATLIKK